MVPAANSSKGLFPADPPIYDPSGDQHLWCRIIARWFDTVKFATEKGEELMYRTVFAALSNHLYDRGLLAESKSLVDKAKGSGQMNYKQDDQAAAVKEIVELLAVEPHIAVVTWLIGSFNRVTNGTCRSNEEFSSFISIFRGLAADHLMYAGDPCSSQVG